jgi:CubicO group peptidase (beta-lactamase class C family)
VGDGLLARLAALAAVGASLVVPLACGGGGERATVEDESRWVVAEPADEGFDARALARADRFARRSVPNLTSLLVARHGRLVLERYYRGAARDDRNHVFSITKSVVSALVGIALRDGQLRSVDQRLVEFVTALPGVDPRWGFVTLRDLLTMTSGLEPEGPIPYFATSDPSLDLVVVTTSGAGDQPFDKFEELIERRVLPAVRD